MSTTQLRRSDAEPETAGEVIDPNRLRVSFTNGLAERLGQTDVPLILTLFLVILATSSAWYIHVPVVSAAIVGVLFRNALLAAGFWYGLAAVLAADVVAHRWSVDNHQYLIVYWCLALGVSAGATRPLEVRRSLARTLIGVVFLLATIWKVLSPDFLDGSFLTYTLLTDPRFDEVARGLGDANLQDLAANRSALQELHDPRNPVTTLSLTSTTKMGGVGLTLAWLTIIVEAGVAILFLLPERLRTAFSPLHRLRDPLLVLFALGTYAVAPVVGFGWVLLIMGLTQRDKESTFVSVLYVASFLAILAFTSPWADIVGITT